MDLCFLCITKTFLKQMSYISMVRNHSENITGGGGFKRGVPRFCHLSGGEGHPDFTNHLWGGSTPILANTYYP